MKIDIDSLTYKELVDLNHRIVERLRTWIKSPPAEPGKVIEIKANRPSKRSRR